jgi:hypothetical protein
LWLTEGIGREADFFAAQAMMKLWPASVEMTMLWWSGERQQQIPFGDDNQKYRQLQG